MKKTLMISGKSWKDAGMFRVTMRASKSTEVGHGCCLARAFPNMFMEGTPGGEGAMTFGALGKSIDGILIRVYVIEVILMQVMGDSAMTFEMSKVGRVEITHGTLMNSRPLVSGAQITWHGSG